jgi:hypothetical protein
MTRLEELITELAHLIEEKTVVVPAVGCKWTCPTCGQPYRETQALKGVASDFQTQNSKELLSS